MGLQARQNQVLTAAGTSAVSAAHHPGLPLPRNAALRPRAPEHAAAVAANKNARHVAGHSAWDQTSPRDLLEVIGRSHVGGAFAIRPRCEMCEHRSIMIGAEFIVPVAIARINVPDASFAPHKF